MAESRDPIIFLDIFLLLRSRRSYKCMDKRLIFVSIMLDVAPSLTGLRYLKICSEKQTWSFSSL